MSTHNLKIQTVWLDRVVSGEKRVELRKHDRDFQVGDVLHLTEVNAFGNPITYPTDSTTEGPDAGHRTFDVRVTHVLNGRLVEGLMPGYCLLSIAPVAPRLNWASVQGGAA